MAAPPETVLEGRGTGGADTKTKGRGQKGSGGRSGLLRPCDRATHPRCWGQSAGSHACGACAGHRALCRGGGRHPSGSRRGLRARPASLPLEVPAAGQCLLRLLVTPLENDREVDSYFPTHSSSSRGPVAAPSWSLVTSMHLKLLTPRLAGCSERGWRRGSRQRGSWGWGCSTGMQGSAR